ncbi:MAG: hypothetical protein ACFFDN_20745 [Candidatus Hodarchaeota archaeon]
MKTNKYLNFVFILVVMVTCGKTSLRMYAPHTDYPKAIYVESKFEGILTEGKIASDKVEEIWKKGKIASDKFVYVDISMYSGKKAKGKLIQISEEYVELSKGYYYKKDPKDDIILKFEKVVTIPKSEILLMKIW